MGSWEGQVSESKPEPSCCRGGGGGAGAGETAGCRVEPGLACLWPWECREGRALLDAGDQAEWTRPSVINFQESSGRWTLPICPFTDEDVEAQRG